jgi:hypothetical protein
MSDLVKAQNLPQFNWYTCWTSLGANGMPDKLIKEGLNQHPIKSRSPLRIITRRLPVMLRLTRLDLAQSTS